MVDELGEPRFELAALAFHVPGSRVGEQRIERLEVAEDRPQRHPGTVGDLVGRGRDPALAQQLDDRVDGGNFSAASRPHQVSLARS